MSETFVIVGAGLAGAKSAEALRDQGFTGRLVLLGAEPHRPYERPPLSKGFLKGKTPREDVFVHPQAWYADHDVELNVGQAVTSIDRAARKVELTDGTTVGYDQLLLTTGASSRQLSVPGHDARGVQYLRTIDDAETLQQTLREASRLIVVGAGWIGLEVTAAARRAGVQVTVIETAELPLLRVLGPDVAPVFDKLHREHDVDFRFGASLAEITADSGHATGVRLVDGTTVAADAVLVGVGAVPNVGLGEAAGLYVDNGIVVDAGLHTDDPNIYAAGDVANVFHPLFGKHIRVEHWANALNQSSTVATSMLGGDAAYDKIPFFYTDQYDFSMEYRGYTDPGNPHDVVFRGDVPGREFIAFWLSGGRVVAGMNVNIWDVGDPIKALISSRATVDPARLADLSLGLADLAAQAST